MTGLAIDVRKRLGNFELTTAFEAQEELLVLFGHSGSGKSQTLRMIAGLTTPDAGQITYDGSWWFDSERSFNLPARRRSAGYALQNPALFPHMSVAENIAFGMKNTPERDRRAMELLAGLGLEGFENRKPATLSGGQQQRVALARALGRRAQLLLLDEPFSALDESLRAGLRAELLQLRAQMGLTILFVTHDLREAHLLADRLAVFDDGEILQLGPRDDVFRKPSSRRVAELTGVSNIWGGRVVAVEPPRTTVSVNGLVLVANTASGDLQPGDAVDVMVRAERVNLRRELHPSEVHANLTTTRIIEEFAYGSAYALKLQPEGIGPEIEVEIAARPYEVLGISHRREFAIEIDPADIHIVRAD
ncbi:MAG TPA: ABC transporter ATP-binding protein [Dehalococcoidia bacterium]|nr:ABC transporter ATP-binding protein [Dehalococcoidia bacterium]